MYRAMVFCDQYNFQKSMAEYYSNKAPKLNYNLLFENICAVEPNAVFHKAMVFIARPCDELLANPKFRNEYEWLSNLALSHRVEVVEGELRFKRNPEMRFDAFNKETYTPEEKGVDVNLSIHALSKAYLNVYDIAFVMSGDTDFVNLYKMLRDMGKLVYVVVVKNQNITRILPYVDGFINMDEAFFNKCLRN